MRKRREPDFTTYILGDPNMNPLDLFNQVKEMIEKKILKQERLKPKIGQILKKGFRIEL